MPKEKDDRWVIKNTGDRFLVRDLGHRDIGCFKPGGEVHRKECEMEGTKVPDGFKVERYDEKKHGPWKGEK